MPTLSQQVSESVSFIKKRWAVAPRVAIVLGSGLGGFAKEIDAEQVIGYRDIPHFKNATAIGHDGRLVCGKIGMCADTYQVRTSRGEGASESGEAANARLATSEVSVCAMSGRFHYYEGYSANDVAFPIRVLRALGAEILIVSNACGGLNPLFHAGDVMAIQDHVNFMFQNPLIGRAGGVDGIIPPQRPIYDQELLQVAMRAARLRGIPLHMGVYCGVSGPNYESRAEIRMLRMMGVDVVGMSTIPEAIVGGQLGMRVLGLSAVTNKCSPDVRVETTGEHVVVAAESTQPKMRDIVMGVISEL